MELPHMNGSNITRKLLCIAVLLCTAVWSANAVNIVNNGGFETGNFSGWTVNDPSGFSNVGPDPLFAHSGNFHANLGAVGLTGSLSQSLTTVAGTSYTLSFWLANDSSTTPNSFAAFFNGVQVFAIANSPIFGYTQFTFAGLVATSSSTTLEFRYRHDADFFRLDDVSVDAGAAGVPEAFSTIWLALPAFGALGLMHFSRGRSRKSLAHI
jgi:hypothetical protein